MVARGAADCKAGQACPSAPSPLAVADQFRVCAVAAVGADEQELRVDDDAVAALAARDFDLVAPVDVVIPQKAGRTAAGQWVGQVDIPAVEQVEVGQPQAGDAQRVKLRDDRLFFAREGLRAACLGDGHRGAFPAERVTAASLAAAAIGQPRAGCTAIQAA